MGQMGKFLIALTFLGSNSDLDLRYINSFDSVRRALLEYPEIKSEIQDFSKETEGTVKDYTGLTDKEFAYFVYAYPLAYNKISTKPFKYSIDFGSFKFRPELEYKFSGPERLTGALVLNKSF